MKIKFFTMELQNATELKNAFRDLAKKNHPDVGGTNEDMKAINAEYEHLFANVHALGRKKLNEEEQKKKDLHDVNDMYREQLIKVMFLKGINAEVMGYYLWVSGDTYTHAQVFRDAGFKWANTQKAWFWYNGLDPKAKRRPFFKNLQEVRNAHGSYGIRLEEQKQLTKSA